MSATMNDGKPRILFGSLLFGVAVILAGCAGSVAPAPEASVPAEAVASPTAAATAPPATAAASAATAVFSGQEAHRHVQQLAGVIGSRPTGTDKEQAAADYIAAELARSGYKVEQQPFDFEDYEERSSSLQLSGPSSGDIITNALYFSPGGDVSAALVTSGLGRPGDFPSGVSGRIALIQRGTIPFTEKVANAAQAGARGAVIYNNVAGEFRGSLGRPADIPAVGITREDGERLEALLRQSAVQVRLAVDAGARIVNSRNVVARAGESCRIIIGGHYDSVPAGPGANDNASGTATAMEAARVLRSNAGTQGLCFVAFGGEELGLWGSRRFVEALSEQDKGRVRAMINLDMVGVGQHWRIYGSDSLRELAADAAKSLDVAAQSVGTSGREGGGSDHASFLRAGIPAVFFHRQDDPNYHTAEDKAGLVDPAALEAAGKMVVGLVERLSQIG